MKFLLSTGIGYKTHTLKELEELALREGFDGLELNLPPRHLPPEETSRDVDYSSLTTIRTVHAPGDLYDERRFASALFDATAIAKQVGASLINIHPPALSVGGRNNVRRGIELIKATEKESLPTIAYEVLVNPYGLEKDRQAYFLEQQAYTSLDAYVADIEKYGLAATLDTAHLGAWDVAPHEYIARFGKHLAHVHMSDYSAATKREHLLLGEGDLDLVTFLNTLERSHPNITVTVELHPVATRQEVIQAAQQSMRYIKQA